MPAPVDEVRLPFPNRAAAGEALGSRVARTAVGPKAIVLAIPRGGVPVAAAVARHLRVGLDVLVAHKISAPWHRELAIGAVAADGTRVIDADGAVWLGDADAIRDAAVAELERAREREHWLRAGRPALRLDGMTAVLVDDGMAMGATMEAAVLSARRSGASRVIVAVPVSSREAVARLAPVADEVIALATPESFSAVGEWYDDFRQVSDREAAALLAGGLEEAQASEPS